MTTATPINADAVAAGNGTKSTPVKLALNAATIELSVQFKVVTTRAASPSVNPTGRKTFKCFVTMSPDDITLTNVERDQRGCIEEIFLYADRDQNISKIQKNYHIKGANAYFWYETPASSDAYAISVQTTEIGS